MADALRNGRGAAAIWPVQSALEPMPPRSQRAAAKALTRGIAGDVVERFYALGFWLEQMRQNLKDLERCVSHWSKSGQTLPAIKPDDGVDGY